MLTFATKCLLKSYISDCFELRDTHMILVQLWMGLPVHCCCSLRISACSPFSVLAWSCCRKSRFFWALCSWFSSVTFADAMVIYVWTHTSRATSKQKKKERGEEAGETINKSQAFYLAEWILTHLAAKIQVLQLWLLCSLTNSNLHWAVLTIHWIIKSSQLIIRFGAINQRLGHFSNDKVYLNKCWIKIKVTWDYSRTVKQIYILPGQSKWRW